jgi:DNA-directed RNA polymerase specialized sigma24 family protein
MASVRGKLRASGVSLDHDDLEACYATAWQGLYAVVLEGQEIANPTGWLVLVTYRRALEEHRARVRTRCAGECGLEAEGGREQDLVEQLDARVRLRHLFEGLRGRLDGREREVATLCYLQGLSRSEAAARMGVSETRMRKLMDGRGPGRPGVAAKVGALLGTICDGDWCKEQSSLMRALAFGILDPEGDRYRLALMHHSECPACRAYIVSLRGLAAALPPALLPSSIAAAALARAAGGLHAGARAAGGGTGTAGGFGGAASASGAAGAAGASGAAGGGWLLGAGPLGAKLAVGCLFALGVGAGCAALEGGLPAHGSSHGHHHVLRESVTASANARARDAGQLAVSAPGAARAQPSGVTPGAGRPTALTAPARASREFGPERALASGTSAGAGKTSAGAATASAPAGGQPLAQTSSAGTAASAPTGGGRASATPPSSGDSPSAAAAREFSPG